MYRELAIRTKGIGLETNTYKTKLLIQSRREDKQIHSKTLMGGNNKGFYGLCTYIWGLIKVQIPARRMRSKEGLIKQRECVFHCCPSWDLE
jgi:hypothetical protein